MGEKKKKGGYEFESGLKGKIKMGGWARLGRKVRRKKNSPKVREGEEPAEGDTECEGGGRLTPWSFGLGHGKKSKPRYRGSGDLVFDHWGNPLNGPV